MSSPKPVSNSTKVFISLASVDKTTQFRASIYEFLLIHRRWHFFADSDLTPYSRGPSVHGGGVYEGEVFWVSSFRSYIFRLSDLELPWYLRHSHTSPYPITILRSKEHDYPGADDASTTLFAFRCSYGAWSSSEAGSLASFTPSFPATFQWPPIYMPGSFNPDPRSKGSCINSSQKGTPYATIVESVYITLILVKTSP